MKKQSRYPEGWPDLPSVTEVLDEFRSKQLMYWFKAKSIQEIKAIGDKSKDIGKTVHKIIEDIEKTGKLEIQTEYPDEVKSCVTAYLTWRKGQDIKKIENEVKLFDLDLGYKGTLDRLSWVADGLYLDDWKTAKGVYLEHKIQVIAYKKLYEKSTGFIVSGCRIIRLGKENAELEVHPIPNDEHEQLFAIFNHYLQIVKLKKQLKEKVNA